MRVSKSWRCLSLVTVLILMLPTAGVTAADRPAPPLPEIDQPAAVLDVLPAWALTVSPEAAADVAPSPSRDTPPPSPHFSRSAAPAAVTPRLLGPHAPQVFTNTWSYSTIGMVYDPGGDLVRYAHESQSSSHNPTIYDVDAVSHNSIFSIALSSVNSGWPWQIDNRTGAGYDFVEETYFLPDYNGDLSYADDNIVEIMPDGTILNAWEMDDEVGSNDSSDGSEIDSIIDIAVVPGTPPRYFVSAAYDGSVMYEVALTKTGAWWTPNSWHTVSTCTVPGLSDNLGIDYDAQNEVLYHSGWHTTTVVVTDLGCNVLAEFDCPGAGGYNSGVTFIEGSVPPQVWVTDFSSDQTTICDSQYGEAPPDPGWEKWVAVGQEDPVPWNPDLILRAQTSDTIVVVDVITAVEEFVLTELWDPEHLRLLDWNVDPPAGGMDLRPGAAEFFFPPGPPQVVTITKWFHVEPCTWTETQLYEMVSGLPVVPPERPIIIQKWLPQLSIDSEYGPSIAAGGVASFTLVYGNTGGRETDAMIRNEFSTAPFVFSDPWPDRLAADGSWVEWDVGALPAGITRTIDVFVFVDPTLPISTLIPIWDGIYNHAGELEDEVVTEFHITEGPPPVEWVKTVNGEPWFPGINVVGQVSDTFVVEDLIIPVGPVPFVLFEEWNPDHLRLDLVDVLPPIGIVTAGDGWLRWEVTEPLVEPVTLIKEFHIEPCTWTETLLWEELWVEGFEPQFRPVEVRKTPPDLWIDSFFDVTVYPEEEAEFVLEYGNWGGYENEVRIQNIFPPEAPFAGSIPPPTVGEPGDLEVWWIFTDGLATDQAESITVTVDIAPGLPPSTTIEIWDGIYNHVGEFTADTLITFHVPPPEWEKWVNGRLWHPGDFAVPVLTSDTITVTDVISTQQPVQLVEHWVEDADRQHLHLLGIETEPPVPPLVNEPGFVEWELPPGVYTITKWFHVEPCTWTYTVLWEELWVEGFEWERRPVHIDKPPVEMVIDGLGGGVSPGEEAIFQLEYVNLFDREFGAWISNTFPAEAPFAWSDPDPTASAPDGRWAMWELPPLDGGEGGLITVAVDIDPTLVPSDTIEIWDGIYNHAGELEDEVLIRYHVEPPLWRKWVNGEPWREELMIPAYTSDTITVTDVVYTVPDVPNIVLENWDPDRLELLHFAPTGGDVFHDPAAGMLEWVLPPLPEIGVYTLTKWFHVRPCTWTETVLWEELWVGGVERGQRPVLIEKPPPELAIDSFFDVFVTAGEQASFQLQYTNLVTGDVEPDARIMNTFPVTASFAGSDPEPTDSAPDGTWAVWDLPLLEPGYSDVITVVVDIAPELPPSTTIEIWDGIYNHAGELEDWTVISFHVNHHIYLPLVLKDS